MIARQNDDRPSTRTWPRRYPSAWQAGPFFYLLLAALLALLMVLLIVVTPESYTARIDSAAALGGLILAAYLFGKTVASYRLPQITGYLLAGIVFGPYVLNLVKSTAAAQLGLINRLALGIIALTAGGELKVAKLRPDVRRIAALVASRFVFVPVAVALFLLFFFDTLSVSSASAIPHRIAAVLVLGFVSAAISPSTTVAVMNETQSAGPMTERALAVAIAIDVAILAVFAPVLAVSELLVQPGGNFQLHLLLEVAWEILSALPIGAVLGFGVVWYLRYVKEEVPVFLLGLVFFATEMTHAIKSDPILTCLVMGFVAENFTDQGETLIREIERSSLPIYVVFFAVAGAALDLSALRTCWLAALALVSVRLAATYFSADAAARMSGESKRVRRHLWTGFIGQAGVSLGLAALVANRLPPPLGNDLRTLIVAAIVLNQIVGPVLFRIGLEKAGEIGKRLPRVGASRPHMEDVDSPRSKGNTLRK